ncbi:hypothetical protein [Aporhodopirellula aestuarii]|uniref:Uncharacterized protein n=1 Tax=Aporhodopirellula aestuarii TaxID=2950107 RepID=A0ABT0UEC4_9BACT|nr:hypothetical protein [Aporhodopirellula aestuarii]MCM2375065.1 hypothetical protein [Aporhodopirellula aestuarii]
MTDAPNPYQPPTSIDESAGTGSEGTIELHGHVSFDDLVALIGTPWLFRVLQIVSLLGGILTGVLPLIFAAAHFNDAAKALPMLGFGIAIIGTLTLVNWWFSRKQRARRLAKQPPGIIGPVDGRINDFGLVYRSDAGERDYQISWAAFTDVGVTPKGIRLGWHNGVPTTIVIPTACIENCPIDALHNRLARYRKNATEPAIVEVVPEWDQTPEGAIRFQSFVPLKPPLTQAESRRMKILNWVTLASWAVAINLLWFFGFPTALAFIAASQGLIYWVFKNDFLRAAPDPYIFRMWGWITPESIHGYLPGTNWIAHLKDAVRREVIDDTIQVEFPDGSGVALASTNLYSADGERWPEVIEIIQRTTNTLE